MFNLEYNTISHPYKALNEFQDFDAEPYKPYIAQNSRS